MTMITLFRADLFTRANVGTEDQRKDIVDRLYQLKQETPPSPNTNRLCWRMKFPLGDISWLAEEIKLLATEAIDYYKDQDPGFKIFANENTNFSFSYWANINEPRSRNVLHDHRHAHFAAVYYLQGKDCGSLRFPHPSNIIMSDVNDDGPFVRDFEFEPTDGDLVLFPALSAHEVDVNLSNRDRVNLAYNITMVKDL